MILSHVKIHRQTIQISSLVLLAFLFGVHASFAQIPKLLQKFEQKNNQIQSGYIKVQKTSIYNEGKPDIRWQNEFFISTQRDLKYLTYQYYSSIPDTDIYCKSAYTVAGLNNRKEFNWYRYMYEDDVYNYYSTGYDHFSYPIEVRYWRENSLFQRIRPKMSKKNIRYRICHPDNGSLTDWCVEVEFEKKTFHLVQTESSYNNLTDNDLIERTYIRTDIIEHQLYEYIHPDILDTISFQLEELKKGYHRQCAVEQIKKDSILRDSVVQAITGKWAAPSLKDVEQDTFFMPKWKFPLVSGDTIYSDSINAQFLLIDMWFINCSFCRDVMRDMVSIDILYDESLLKILNLNALDKDTTQMRQLVRAYNLKCDVAYSYGSGDAIANLSKKMRLETCLGYPQLYLIEMKTKQVLWNSCGYRKGFTREIEEIIKLNKWKKQ